MSFTDELLTTLALPRPTETELIHRTTVINVGGSIEGYCNCQRWFMESAGTDETSRAWVHAAARKHTEDAL